MQECEVMSSRLEEGNLTSIHSLLLSSVMKMPLLLAKKKKGKDESKRSEKMKK